MSHGMTDVQKMRVLRLRNQIDQMNRAGVYKTDLYRIAGASCRESEGEPVQIRRAKAIAKLLNEAEISVFDHEPIVGSMIGLWSLVEDLPGYAQQKQSAIQALAAFEAEKSTPVQLDLKNAKMANLEDEVSGKQTRWALMSRVHHDASLSYDDYQRLLDEMVAAFPNLEKYEIGKVLERQLKIRYNEQERAMLNALPWIPGNHLGLAYWLVTERGLGAITQDIEARLDKEIDPAKREYYQAARITVRAMSAFILRHARVTRAKAEEHGADPKRRRELLFMADILDRIATHPADSYREALQTVWILHIMANLIGGSAMSFSRFDQYMRPYYERDIKRGVPRSELFELTCCFWLKVNEPKLRTVQSLTVGGVTPDGRDGASDLTRLCLEVTREMKLPYPNIGVRINDLSPDWLSDEVMETVKAGCGQPMVLNDRVFIKNLMKLGYPEEAANDYYNMGCVEIMIPGKQPTWGGTDGIAFPLFFSDLFTRYRKSGLAPDTFEGFMEDYLGLIRDAVDVRRQEALAKQRSIVNACYDPFCSILTEDCIERGVDMHQGGSRYPATWSVYAHGLGTLTDSLTAIKKFVYDEHKIALMDLIGILEADFAGNEALRARLDRLTPAFGNDMDEPDELGARVFEFFTNEVFKLNQGGDGPKYVSTFFSYFSHVLSGEVLMATANGRKHGEPLSDSMAPSQGKDTGGPTRMLNSVLKIDHGQVTGGYALNLKINPSLVKSAQGTSALKALIKAYLLADGPQIQINYVDVDALREAQRDPGAHRNLIVRVGGYCEYFVNLDRTLQDEIIARTIHDAM